jgi:hypothetical protein
MAHAIEAAELEDLEDVDEIDAGCYPEQTETEHDERPAGVQVAFVVAVGDEAQREREAGEHQGPGVEVGDGAPAGEADAGHAVVEMLAIGAIDGLLVLQPLEHHEGGVEEGDRQQDERQHEGDDGGGLHGGLHGDHPHQ